MKIILTILYVGLLGLNGVLATPPNVVIIYADDMGFGDLGANNPDSKIPTPRLDRLAEQGMRFTDGHSSSGICTPSRFAMLTGQHHWRRFHGIVGMFGPNVFKGETTLAHMFEAKGYNTACIGKWHLGWDWKTIKNPDSAKVTKQTPGQVEDFDWNKPISGGPCSQGFDYYFGDGTINFPPYCWMENDRVLQVPTQMFDATLFKKVPEGTWGCRPGPMSTDWNPYDVLPTLADKAVTWLEKQSKDTPFFLYFPLPSPHEPIVPLDEYSGTSEAGPYGDYIVESDAMIGRVLDALSRKGFDQNTIVIFTADNGSERFAYERLQKFDHCSAGPFRGVKRDLWEGGHRVPLTVRWPGKIAPGSVSDETISQVDFYATFAAAIDYSLDSNEAIDSYNLLPLLQGKDYVKPLRTATVQNTNRDIYALRQGDWILLNANSGENTKSPEWYNTKYGYAQETTPGLLYNLKDDPAQRTNLYTAYPEKVAEMTELLERYRAGEGCAPHAK